MVAAQPFHGFLGKAQDVVDEELRRFHRLQDRRLDVVVELSKIVRPRVGLRQCPPAGIGVALPSLLRQIIQIGIVAEGRALTRHETLALDLDIAVEDVALREMHRLAVGDPVALIPGVEIMRWHQPLERRASCLLELDDDVVSGIPGGPFEQHVIAWQPQRGRALSMPHRHVLDLERAVPPARLDAVLAGEGLDQLLELIDAAAHRGQFRVGSEAAAGLLKVALAEPVFARTRGFAKEWADDLGAIVLAHLDMELGVVLGKKGHP